MVTKIEEKVGWRRCLGQDLTEGYDRDGHFDAPEPLYQPLWVWQSRSRERNELASQVMRNRFPEPRAHHLGRKYTPHAPGQQQGYVQHCELKCLSDTHAIERMAIERRMRHAKPTLRLF